MHDTIIIIWTQTLRKRAWVTHSVFEGTKQWWMCPRPLGDHRFCCPAAGLAWFYRQYLMCCHTSLFRDGCHHILAAVLGGQIVLSQCWQEVWLFYNKGHHILVTTIVLKRGREKEVIPDQHAYILWLFVLGNGVGCANHITRSRLQWKASSQCKVFFLSKYHTLHLSSWDVYVRHCHLWHRDNSHSRR